MIQVEIAVGDKIKVEKVPENVVQGIKRNWLRP